MINYRDTNINTQKLDIDKWYNIMYIIYILYNIYIY